MSDTTNVLKEFVNVKRAIEDNNVIQVWYKNKVVYEWYDNANCDYPEDLCWEREISEVFFSGMALGVRLARNIADEQVVHP